MLQCKSRDRRQMTASFCGVYYYINSHWKFAAGEPEETKGSVLSGDNRKFTLFNRGLVIHTLTS